MLKIAHIFRCNFYVNIIGFNEYIGNVQPLHQSQFCFSKMEIHTLQHAMYTFVILVRFKYRLICSRHYSDVIMGAIASQTTDLTIVYSIVYWDADQRKHQSSASLAFVRGIHRGPVNSPHKWPVTRKMFPFWWRHHGSQGQISDIPSCAILIFDI